MNKLQRLYRKVETIYWQEGVLYPDVRHILVWQTAIISIGFILSLISCMYSTWFIWFTLGAIVSLWNIYALTKNVLAMFKSTQHISFIRFFIYTNLRLLLTAFLGYVVLVKLGASLLAVFLGVTSLSLTIIIYTITSMLKIKSY